MALPLTLFVPVELRRWYATLAVSPSVRNGAQLAATAGWMVQTFVELKILEKST
jgi:hypothetical protein